MINHTENPGHRKHEHTVSVVELTTFEMEIDYKKEALRLADFDTDAGKLINIFMHN